MISQDDYPTHAIGVLARETATKVETIRYYERIGLLPAPARTEGGHRLYSPAQLRRLAFIRRARELGFTLDAVRVLLRLVDGEGQSCAEVERIASLHRDEVRAKIADLQALDGVLSDMVEECQGGTLPTCPIVEALSGDRI